MPIRIVLQRTGFAYLKHSHIAGYKHIVSTDRPLIERFLWALIVVSGIALTIWLVVSSYLSVLETPTVTSEDPKRMRVIDIDFPGVAICSENRISRVKLEEFSEFILHATMNKSKHLGRTVNEIAKNLLILINVYDIDVTEEDLYHLDKLHTVLLEVYDGPYPLQKILIDFAPKCDNLIQRCKWLGRTVDCKTIFGSRRTFTGMCCVFNHLRPLPSSLRAEMPGRIDSGHPAHIKTHGHNFGLMVLLNQRRNDYACTLRSNIGARVLVYNPYNFPDHISGAVKQRFLGIGEEMLMTVNAITVNGGDAMREYTVESRDCVFDDEIKLVNERIYSLNECLLTCRLTEIGKFCDCILPQYNHIVPNLPMCLLDDMSCLSRWKLNWFNLEPIATNFRRSNEEAPDLHCPHCRPTCSVVKYRVDSSKSYFDQGAFVNRRFDRSFTDGLNSTSHSIVYVNFAKNTALVMEQTTLYTWYELMAYFGGIASLTIGASVISLVEVLYYWSGKFGKCAAKKNEQLLYPDDFKNGRNVARAIRNYTAKRV